MVSINAATLAILWASLKHSPPDQLVCFKFVFRVLMTEDSPSVFDHKRLLHVRNVRREYLIIDKLGDDRYGACTAENMGFSAASQPLFVYEPWRY